MNRSCNRLLIPALLALLLFAALGACRSTTVANQPNPTSTTPTNPNTPPTPTSPNPTPPTPTPPSPTPPVEASWTFCANLFSGCQFYGLRDVRYGKEGKYVIKEFFGELPTCRNATFGLSESEMSEGICEYSNTYKTTTLAPPVMNMGPRVDLTKIPRGSVGFSEVRIARTSNAPAEQPTKHTEPWGGEFRTHCDFSHMSFDDPIIYPGQPGRSHLHAFFGNTGTNAASTAQSIAGTGNSTCAGGISNRTAYWVPALIDTRDGAPLVPDDSIWYYKTGGLIAATIKPFPKGLRMIAGNAMSSRAEDSPNIEWNCWNESGQNQKSVPTRCALGDLVVMRVTFPQCWDGVNLDSADHKSHMAYPIGVSGQVYQQCPSSHPIPLVQIGLNLKYKIKADSAPAQWRLSSDMYATDKPGGFSAHADWFDGWDTSMNTWVKHCINDGYDCHGFLLGNGTTQY